MKGKKYLFKETLSVEMNQSKEKRENVSLADIPVPGETFGFPLFSSRVPGVNFGNRQGWS